MAGGMPNHSTGESAAANSRAKITAGLPSQARVRPLADAAAAACPRLDAIAAGRFMGVVPNAKSLTRIVGARGKAPKNACAENPRPECRRAVKAE